MKALGHAFAAGACAAFGSTFGKLSGQGGWNTPFLVAINVLLLCMMIACNTYGLTCFVKALQCYNTSLSPTVISAATNYFLSAAIGCLFFSESTSSLWWIGSFLIMVGVTLICKSQKIQDENKKCA